MIRATRRWGLLFVLVAVLPYLWVLNCSGPRPELRRVRLTPPSVVGGAYQMEAVVRNSGPGHGQVAVIFTLRDTRTGHTYQQDESADLSAGETAVLSAEIPAPPGTYTPNVEVQYPPR